jgi:hypothetical protein
MWICKALPVFFVFVNGSPYSMELYTTDTSTVGQYVPRSFQYGNTVVPWQLQQRFSTNITQRNVEIV